MSKIEFLPIWASPPHMLTNSRISTRIFVGFLSVLVLLGAVGAAGVVGLEAARRHFIAYADVGGIAVAVVEMQTDIGILIRSAQEYSVSGRKIEQTNTEGVGLRLNTSIADARSRTDDAAMLQALGDLSANINQFAGDFGRLVDIKTRQQALSADSLESGIAEIDRKLEFLGRQGPAEARSGGTAIADSAHKHLAHVRSLMERYNNGPLEEDASAIRKTLEEMNSTLANLPADQATGSAVQDISSGIRTVLRHFDALVALSDEADAIVDGLLRVTGRRLTANGQAVRDAATANLARLQGENRKTMSRQETILIALAVTGELVGFLLAWVIALSIIRPVRRITRTMGALAAGDHGVAIPALAARDEIGAMARAVQVFKENSLAIERLRVEQERNRLDAEQARGRILAELADGFQRSVKEVVDAVSSSATELHSAATSMAGTAENATQRLEAFSSTSRHTADNIEQMAAAAEELSSSVGEIGRQVTQSTALAGRAVTEAARTSERVLSLANAAQAIGKVIELINRIAHQTNLLALNATIEAARAGEAGKGFAVVAQEVKNLAGQTAHATEEIAQQIAAIQQGTANMVEAITAIAAMVSDIDQVASVIACAVEQQGLATQVMARNIHAAALGTGDLSSNSTTLTEAVSETGAAADRVLTASNDLSSQSEHLKVEVERFLGHIRCG